MNRRNSKPKQKQWGCVKETAAPDKTMCDYDGKMPADFMERLETAGHILHIKPKLLRIDRTARGYHAIIIWDAELKPAEIVAIQAILGSDYKRELLNLARVRAVAEGPLADEFWNILYSHKLTEAKTRR
jgi:hypothetical protein